MIITRLALNRIVVVRYRMHLESRGLAANTINQQLAAVRRLAHEAADSGLLSPELAAGISRVKGVKQLGFRSGNWLSVEQSSVVLKHAYGDSMRAKRDYAMLAMLFGCGFCRSELVGLELDEVQMRQGHWAVVDLIGKGEITERLKSLNIDFEGASLVTNGYLLDKGKCDLLNELKIQGIQITLDGPEKLHDMRRFVAGGGPTFQRILANVDTLMNSSYEGICHIRVNLDKHNSEGFPELYALLVERFKGKKLSIYAAPVHASFRCSQHSSCSLDLQEWADLTFDTYRRSGFMPSGNFYPTGEIDSVCVGIAHNRFVIGPKGELYKCWEDVGKPAMVVGNIHEADPVTNPELRAQYSIGTDAYNDPECLACSVLPICGGGCANKRLRAKQFGEKGLEFCSPYRKSLIGYLEGYIDSFLTKEICTALLNPIPERPDGNGYRVISPPRLR